MTGAPRAFQGKTETIARVAAMGETTPEADPRKLAEEARDRVRFEEEALDLADQVYRVARRLVSTREEAEDLMQETYARAFRAWRSYTPGTNLRAWLLRILTNLNIDRGRKQQRSPDLQPLEEGDYYLYNRLEEAGRESNADQDRVDERLSQDDVCRGAVGRSARLSRRGRARRHRRLQLRRRGADPRDPDRHRHVPPPSWAAYPETRAGRRGGAKRLMAYAEVDPCDKCEELLQPYLDRELSDAERAEAELHLDGCSYCRKRYRFEENLRQFVRQAAVEEMPPDLKQKLAELRTSLF